MYQEKSQMVLDCDSAGLTLILFPSAGFLRKRHKLWLLQKVQNLFEMTEATMHRNLSHLESSNSSAARFSSLSRVKRSCPWHKDQNLHKKMTIERISATTIVGRVVLAENLAVSKRRINAIQPKILLQPVRIKTNLPKM